MKRFSIAYLITFLLILLGGCKSGSGPDVIRGCTDNSACNYNNAATKNDGSCILPQGCNESCAGDTIIVLELGCDDVWAIYYDVSTPIAGFQFGITGVDVTGVSGGAAIAAGFTVSTGNNIVLGFSLTGATIDAGSGILVVLDVTGSGDACLTDLVVSDSAGQAIDVSENCNTIEQTQGL